jgi:MFS family permease
VSPSSAPRPSYRELFAVGEFRALWTSYILSVAGDRLALVALALLIYDRTRSPLLAAVAYAAGYLPYLVGALFLAGLADRLPRRQVMVACDVIRAALVVAMVLPGMPLGALIALLYVVTSIQPAFDAARSAVLRDVADGPRYPLAAAVMQTTFRIAIVAGAAGGGLAVAFIGARPALAVDAATFAVSALVIHFGTRARPAARSGDNAIAQLGAGVRLVFGDRALRTLLMLGWLTTLYAIPVGIAGPYAAHLRAGAVAAGLIIAAAQVGAGIMTPVFVKKIGPLTRLKWMGPMAVCACAVLLLVGFRPGLAVALVIFTLSGVFSIYQIAANTAFAERVPNERRGQAFGLANAGLVAGQGLAYLAAGAAAEVVPPSTVIALAGGLGALIACGLALRWRGMSPAVGRHTARHLGREASLAGQAPVHAARSH